MARKSDIQELREHCACMGLTLHIWAPGDKHGCRYRFFTDNATCYDSGRPVGTVYGRKNAWAFVHAFAHGYGHADTRIAEPMGETLRAILACATGKLETGSPALSSIAESARLALARAGKPTE